MPSPCAQRASFKISGDKLISKYAVRPRGTHVSQGHPCLFGESECMGFLE
uniref:Uncharacterized protein n=1 Tax=Arundo donax TaxID=35708 RepID=A0A0A8XZL2_ARUDO